MTDLYIIAAGKGSRMGGSVPKALVPITDKPNLTTTLQQIGHKFEQVFVVTNIDYEQVEIKDNPWAQYFIDLRKNFPELSSNVHCIQIKSGRGDGHAVLEALRQNPVTSNDIVIAWGDVFFPDGRIIDEMLAHHMNSGIIPVVGETDPYVSLNVNMNNGVMFAKFSKFNEIEPGAWGYHDQSVFRFDRDVLECALETMDSAFNRNGTYMTPGNELSLLYVFHYLANYYNEVIAYETEYPTLSFNTPEEVAQIQQEIDEKWQHKFRPQS